MEEASTAYPTDVDDLQWEAVSRVIPPRKAVGAERVTSMRGVVNAILYRHRARCSWRMLPPDFPHWRTVYGYYRQWQQDGTWRRINQALAATSEGTGGVLLGALACPSIALAAAPSVPSFGRLDLKHGKNLEKTSWPQRAS